MFSSVIGQSYWAVQPQAPQLQGRYDEQLMRRLTILAMVLPLGYVAGCGGSSSSASFATAEHAWEACKGGAAIGHEDPACKPLAVKACQAETATASNKQAHGGLACEVAEGRYSSSQGQAGESTTTPGHTPEEEEHRRNNLKAEEKTAHEEEALEKTPGAKKACEEEKRTQEKLQYEHPGSPPEPQREAEYEKLCNR